MAQGVKVEQEVLCLRLGQMCESTEITEDLLRLEVICCQCGIHSATEQSDFALQIASRSSLERHQYRKYS